MIKYVEYIDDFVYLFLFLYLPWYYPEMNSKIGPYGTNHYL